MSNVQKELDLQNVFQNTVRNEVQVPIRYFSSSQFYNLCPVLKTAKKKKTCRFKTQTGFIQVQLKFDFSKI